MGGLICTSTCSAHVHRGVSGFKRGIHDKMWVLKNLKKIFLLFLLVSSAHSGLDDANSGLPLRRGGTECAIMSLPAATLIVSCHSPPELLDEPPRVSRAFHL